MIPTAFDEETNVLGPPEGWGEDVVGSLSVAHGVNPMGIPMVISCWKITQDELAEFQRTGKIWLMVVGNTMPPVMLTVHKPIEKS